MKAATTAPGRFDDALDILKQDPHVDTARIGAIGYCFGGGVVLAMARSGADLKAVGTFHGSLATDHPAEAGKLKPKLLVQTGDADPRVTATPVPPFEEEITAARASHPPSHYTPPHHPLPNPGATTLAVPPP